MFFFCADLNGNHITAIEPDSFRGLEDSLHTLSLANNLLSKLPPDSFSTLPLLDTIDLSGNNLAVIDTNIFRDGMPRLVKVSRPTPSLADRAKFY